MLDIDKIALEVANTQAAPYIGDDCIKKFAKAFLARVDQERAKAGAVAWWDPKLGCFDEKQFDQLSPLYLSPTLPVWISVEDRLPNNGTEILCLLKSGEMQVLEFSQQPEWRFIDRDTGKWWKLKVHAWMSLPDAPEVPK